METTDYLFLGTHVLQITVRTVQLFIRNTLFIRILVVWRDERAEIDSVILHEFASKKRHGGHVFLSWR